MEKFLGKKNFFKHSDFGFFFSTKIFQFKNSSIKKCFDFTGSPASKAGLKIGDRIVEINGQPTEGKNHKQIVQIIQQVCEI